jgi:hypothetical protein
MGGRRYNRSLVRRGARSRHADEARRAAFVDDARRALLVDNVRVVVGRSSSRSSGEQTASDDAASDQSVIFARMSGGGRQRGGDKCRDKQLFHDGSFPSQSGTIPAFGRLPAHAHREHGHKLAITVSGVCWRCRRFK